MNFSELRDSMLERLGEITNQAVSSSSDASYGDALILRRLKQSYTRLFGRAKEKGPGRFAIIGSVTYPADTEYIDLSSASYLSGALKHADILGVYESVGSDYDPLKQITQQQYDQLKASGSLAVSLDDESWVYFIDGFNFFVLPKPARALTLRFRYIAELSLSAVTTSTWASHSPDKLPERFHELVSLEAALSFISDRDGVNSGLMRERDELLIDMIQWASDDRKPGVRKVIEV